MTAGMRRPAVGTGSTWLLAALLTVVLAACTGAAGAGNRAAVDPEAGRKYAQCMRGNGVPDFPDPGPDGRFAVSHGPGGIDQDDPKFRAAVEKCRALAPGGEHRNTTDPANLEQMRKYSQCMRDKGVPDFPDPDADGQLRGVGHERQDSPAYRDATAACAKDLPGAGAHR